MLLWMLSIAISTQHTILATWRYIIIATSFRVYQLEIITKYVRVDVRVTRISNLHNRVEYNHHRSYSTSIFFPRFGEFNHCRTRKRHQHGCCQNKNIFLTAPFFITVTFYLRYYYFLVIKGQSIKYNTFRMLWFYYYHILERSVQYLQLDK